MSSLLRLLVMASSAAAIVASGFPAAAQSFYNPYRTRPANSFTLSYTNIRYNLYQPQRYNGFGYPSYGQPGRPSGRGFGHSSGSYFGW